MKQQIMKMKLPRNEGANDENEVANDEIANSDSEMALE